MGLFDIFKKKPPTHEEKVALAHRCYKPEMAVPDYVKSPLPQDYVSNEELPKNYDPYIDKTSFSPLVVTSTDSTWFPSTKTSIFLNIVDLAGLSLLLPLFLTVLDL